MYILLAVYAAALVISSASAVLLFFRDKKLAKSGSIRIMEKTLLGVAAFGGATGALIGSKLAHHKTDKAYFSIVIYSGMILQLAVLALIAVLAVAG